jgi:hypothetical protein
MGYLGYKPADKPLTAADITDSIITSAKITDATIVNGDIANSTIALAKLSATGTASSSTFLRGDNSWASAGAAAGQVIQVVTATDSTERATTSTSYAAVSQLSLSITPSSASNKILILVGSGCHTYAPSGANWTVYRGATNLATGTSQNSFHFTRYDGQGGTNGILCVAFLDSPATTSATTYQVYQKTSSTSAYINIENTTGSITALEIKG